MRRFRGCARARRKLLRGGLVLAALVLLPTSASAAEGASRGAPPSASGALRTAEAEGRVYCTPFGCRGASAASWTKTAAFGAAALAAGWLGRRSRSVRV